MAIRISGPLIPFQSTGSLYKVHCTITYKITSLLGCRQSHTAFPLSTVLPFHLNSRRAFQVLYLSYSEAV